MIKLATTQLWVHDQDEALAFYTEKLGLEVRSDVTLPEMGNFRWLTVGPPGQEDIAIVLMAIPGPPVLDEETAEQIRDLMGKGFAGTVFLTTDDCRPPTRSSRRRGVEFTEAPEERPYGIDAASATRRATRCASRRCASWPTADRSRNRFGCAKVASMRLLVLGGSSFVGRAVVEDGLRRGWRVATFNRGTRPAVDVAVEPLLGDRLDPADLHVLRDREWDVVVDTWSGAPRAAADSAAVLAGRAGVYAYVSSGSVYAPPPPVGGDESSPTVDAAADADGGEYPAQARRRARDRAGVRRAALLARAGLILGPHEDVGRLPWWLLRMHRGGEVLAPGPRGCHPVRRRARSRRWMLDAAPPAARRAYNVVRRAGEETMGSLLETCCEVAGARGRRYLGRARAVLAAGIEPWTSCPSGSRPSTIPRHARRGLERAYGAGLRPRPLRETVAAHLDLARVALSRAAAARGS